MNKSSDPTFPEMDDGSLPDRKPYPATYVQYFVGGVNVSYTGKHDATEHNVRFYYVINQTWHNSPDEATRCNKSQALEYLGQKQNVVGDSRKENFFIIRADITLTRVNIDLVDYVKE